MVTYNTIGDGRRERNERKKVEKIDDMRHYYDERTKPKGQKGNNYDDH